MVRLFVIGLVACDAAERGNMEGKNTRFGVGGSVFAAITTSTGSYNSMDDSYTPLGGAILL